MTDKKNPHAKKNQLKHKYIKAYKEAGLEVPDRLYAGTTKSEFNKETNNL